MVQLRISLVSYLVRFNFGVAGTETGIARCISATFTTQQCCRRRYHSGRTVQSTGILSLLLAHYVVTIFCRSVPNPALMCMYAVVVVLHPV